MSEYEQDPKAEMPIDHERIARAWLAQQKEIENAEDERVCGEIIALAASRGREIFAIVQATPDGSAALPAWGVRKKRG